MSYQVLARKWRPGNFREMVGQEHVLKALINALDHNRLHHAYLFTGTRGVGKTTIARILAKCLNCDLGVTSTPCGECSSCVEISEGRFVDLIEVDAASRTKVEDTRELLDNVQYAPTRGRYKIYLIDEVHMLSNHSFNALLKTLEEPPEHVKFLLATTDPQKLPVTILSRCLQFNLKNMSPERIVGHLQQVLEQEVVPVEEAALWLLARSADGSMRDALSLTDQAIAYGNGKITEPEVAAMLGTIDHQLIQKLMQGLIAAEATKILEAVAHFAEHAPDFNAALSDLLTLLHRIAIAQAMPEALDNSFGDREQVLGFAEQLTSEDVQLFYQTALIGRRDLHLSPDERSGFEMTLLRMLAFKPQGLVDVPRQGLSSSATRSQVAEPVPQSPSDNHPSAPTKPEEPLTKKPPAEVEPAPVVPEASISAHVIEQQPEQEAENNNQQVKELLKQQIKAITGKEGISSPAVEPAPALNNVDTSEAKLPEPAAVGETLDAIEQFDNARWLKVFFKLNIKGTLHSATSNAVLMGNDGVTLFFALDVQRGTLFNESHNQQLADLLSEFFQQPIKVDINLQALPEGLETPSQWAERDKQERHQHALQQLAVDPVIQTLQREFGAQLDENSVSY
ncbi:DNA polymerase-3 subunit gamma/tau [Alteromonadaceae bacterium Bs31]|nr:DNA polymerase-3 subunit gamma/tau [Alteromonadaceae bacterium Bs31]